MSDRPLSFLFAIVLIALVASCDSGEPPAPTPEPEAVNSAPAETPTAAPSPGVTPASVPTSSGWLVFARDRDLYLGALDGSGVQRLTTGARDAGYAGVALTGGTRWLYFIEPNDGETSGTEVRRRLLDGGATESLFTFDAGAERSGWGAAVSPDGSMMAYAAHAGLVVRNLASGDERLVRANNLPCDTPGRCRKYREPAWSADGAWISVIAGQYEGGAAELVSLSGEVIELAKKAGGNFLAWAPTGNELCASEFGYAIGSAGILRADAPLYVPLQRADGVAPPAIWCGWSPTGQLAVSVYDAPAPNSSSKQLALVGDDGAIGPPIHVAPTSDSVLTQFVWLPDGSGLVSQLALPCIGCAGPPGDIVLMLDGTTRMLPFETGRVVAAIAE